MYLQPPRSARKQCVALDTYCTYLLSSLGNIKGLWFPYRPLKCWPEINRLPDIFSSKDGSLRTSREFQFEVWNHGQSPSSLCTAREGECFYRGEKEGGKVMGNKDSIAFHWLSPWQEGRGVFLLPLGLCYQGMRNPLLISQFYFIVVYVY